MNANGATRMTPRTWVLVGILVVSSGAWAGFHRQINRALVIDLLLHSQIPREELFNELAGQGADPGPFLRRCWATGKVTHRQLVATFLEQNADKNSLWFAGVRPLLIAGVTDADLSVRELALTALAVRHDPSLLSCAQAQLNDPDPSVRSLGLDHLRKTGTAGVPVAMRLLDDADLQIVAAAELALMRWTGEDFGVRMRLALPAGEGEQPGEVRPADVEKIKQGIERRRAWWQLHQKEFPEAPVAELPADPRAQPRLPATDFTLIDLEGKPTRLKDFRGKIVLLNFWATWCGACLTEIADLAALQKQEKDRVVVVGIALDGVPVEHLHGPAAEPAGEVPANGPTMARIREKVSREAAARGINYTVLLDPNNSVGGRFNGGELPTTVIIDAEGRVCRRFEGERRLKVFEAMISQAAGHPSRARGEWRGQR